MSLTMEMQTAPSFDWAQDTFMALHDSPSKQSASWVPFADVNGTSAPPFTIPPSLLSSSSVARYGQVTPPEELSPTGPSTREGSIPPEELRNESNWPQQSANVLHVVQNTHPAPELDTTEPAAKRRRTSRQSSSNQKTTQGTTQPQQSDDVANPQPPKRKRGRPKSQPQMVEAFTADGFPFQVSSARQSHLEKNRVAAHKCRQRKKEYINGLEGRAREYSSKNKALKENVAMLREEVLGLKNEVLRHAGCGFWAVDEYLARCAGDLLGMGIPEHARTSSQSQSASQSPFLSDAGLKEDPERKGSMDSAINASSPDEDYGLELLQGFDDDDMDEMEDWQ